MSRPLDDIHEVTEQGSGRSPGYAPEAGRWFTMADVRSATDDAMARVREGVEAADGPREADR
jgi:hypothetical protein